LERGHVLLAEAAAEREAAVAAVVTAREADAAELAKKVRTRSDVAAPGATRKARQRAEAAEDSVEVSRAALAKLEAGLADAEAAAQRAELAVAGAVNRVLAAEAAIPLIERLEKLKREIPSLQASLHHVRNRASIPHGAYREEVDVLAEPLREIMPRLVATYEHGVSFHLQSIEQHPAAAALAAACAALATDADAPLPSI
jgi:chromosome segregation ATPase